MRHCSLNRSHSGAGRARHCGGFSLFELSVVLVIVGVIAGVALGLKQSGTEDCVGATKAQLAQIDQAIHAYVVKHDKFPLPALRTAGVEDPQYGREAGVAGLDVNAGVVFGALPFQALGLAPSYAGDCWGNKLTYAVTEELTDKVKFLATAPGTPINGNITIQSAPSVTVSSTTAYAVVSHGLNASGAVKVNYRDATNTERRWCSAGSAVENENCDIGNATLMAAAFNDGKDAGANLFDDVITFGGKPSRSMNGVCNNAIPLGCAPGIVANDNGQTGCGETHTWHCNGAAGGTNALGCSFTNPACANCNAGTLSWGAGCIGGFPATVHGATSSPATTNTNAAFTGTATATCTNGVFTASGSCTPTPPPAGACNNAIALGCASGAVLVGSDNGQTACGTTRTWVCQGSSPSPTCSFTNAACLGCAADGETWGGGCVGDFPPTAHGATTPVVNNSNGAYTGSATRTCTDGVFSAPVGPCGPVAAEDGACDNATAGACVAGVLQAGSDDNITTCGETRHWTCDGRNGGNPAPTCTKVNGGSPLPSVNAIWQLYGTTDFGFIFPSGRSNPPRNNCPVGYTPTALLDDEDGQHFITEARGTGRDRGQLCMKTSDTDVQITSTWTANRGACPAGFIDTGVYDSQCDKPYQHYLPEDEEGRCLWRWCLGITGSNSADFDLKLARANISCPAGWTQLLQTNNNKWDVEEEDGRRSQEALCVKLDYKPTVCTAP